MTRADRFKELLNTEGIEEFADDRQREFISLYRDTRSLTEVARATGVPRSTIYSALDRLEARAARVGFAPKYDQTKPAPPGQVISGVSTLYDASGKVSAQWVKTAADRQAQADALRVTAEELASHITPVQPTPHSDEPCSEELTVYPFGIPI